MAFNFASTLSNILGTSKKPTLPTVTPPNYSVLKPNNTVPNLLGSMKTSTPMTASPIPSFATPTTNNQSVVPFGPQPVPQVKAPTPSPVMAPKPVTTPVAPTLPNVNPNANYFGEMNPQNGQNSQESPSGGTNTPAVPTIDPRTQAAYDSASKAYEESLKISPEELSTQEDLDKLLESTKKAYRDTNGQPIPLEFITGQLKSIEERALGLAEPLQTKLARMEAKRTASGEASKFALERAEKKIQAEKDASKPIAGTSFYDPKTGKFIQAPSTEKKPEGFTLSAGEKRYDANGNLIASGGEKPMSAAQESKAIADSEKQTAAQQQNSATLNIVNNLLTADVGKITGAAQNPLNFLGVTNQKEINEYNQLKAQLALGARSLLKGSGAVSDYEAKVLQDSTSSLGRNLNNADFKQALINIRGVLKTNSGQAAEVKVTDPSTGKTKQGPLTGAEIYDAVSQGFAINYL